MKKLILIFAVALLASCSSDDDAGDVISNEFEQIKTILPQGTWEVSKFIKDNIDKTADFESFIFTFDVNGKVVGKNDLFSEQGTWAYKTTAEEGEELVLQFNPVAPFDEISNHWDIVSVSGNKVELSDVGNGSDDTELLIFSKL